MVTQDMKTVFMGTPDFAVPPLKALVEAGYEVAAVVTQPDEAKRKRKDSDADSCKGRGTDARNSGLPAEKSQK